MKDREQQDTNQNQDTSQGADAGGEVTEDVLEREFAEEAGGTGAAGSAGAGEGDGGGDGGGEGEGEGAGDGGEAGDGGGEGAETGGGEAGAGGDGGGEIPDLDAYLAKKDGEARARRLDEILRREEAEAAAAGGGADAGGPTGAGVDVKALLGRLEKHPSLANVKFDSGVEDEAPLTFAEMLTQYPAMVQLSAVLGELLAAERMAPIAQTLEDREADAAMQHLMQVLGGEQYGHTDIQEIAVSDAFWGWVDRQNPRVKALATSLDPEDVDMVLRRYRADSGTAAPAEAAAAAEGRGKQQALRDRERNLHGSTIRPKRQRVTTGGTATAADVERETDEAWAEEEEADRARLKGRVA